MQFKIHKEGWAYFVSSLIITILLFPFFPTIGIILGIFTIYIFYFFRDPERSIPLDDVIVSPADGIVTYIGSSKPPIDLETETNDQYLKISIFLNIFNVHVNRMPTSGVVKKIKYIHGKFINATLEKSSADNERNIILIENHNKENIIVAQIAGLIARRIVCEIKEKQEIYLGHRFGIIKFGSRVDLYLPSHYKTLISVGQTVIAGETLISNPNNIENINKSIKN
ncbi:phosphatidylserine decarboxylase family protein [Alphaproteobacteria bacterium]|nr:phosphatidylserine decarboxylase family protein [Alphaproteobacteria bacterium]